MGNYSRKMTFLFGDSSVYEPRIDLSGEFIGDGTEGCAGGSSNGFLHHLKFEPINVHVKAFLLSSKIKGGN